MTYFCVCKGLLETQLSMAQGSQYISSIKYCIVMTLDKENIQKKMHRAALLETESLKERLRAQSEGNIDIKMHMH